MRLRFDRTAKAVVEYDKVPWSLNPDWFPKHEAALSRVKKAFAEDTKDFNALDTAILVTPDGDNGWLRRLLCNHGHPECAIPKEQREEKGWGW